MAIRLHLITSETTPKGFVLAAREELARALEHRRMDLDECKGNLNRAEEAKTEAEKALAECDEWLHGMGGSNGRNEAPAAPLAAGRLE